VRDLDDAVVPVLYAGDTLGCALCETVLRGQTDSHILTGAVESYRLRGLRASTLELLDAVLLADLRDDALVSYGRRRDDVIALSPAYYSQTVAWSQRLWDETGVQGLVWNSYRSPGLLSYAFFVDPGSKHEDVRRTWRRHFEAEDPLPLHLGAGFDRVLEECEARNITVVR
jgi:hypothetical protein